MTYRNAVRARRTARRRLAAMKNRLRERRWLARIAHGEVAHCHACRQAGASAHAGTAQADAR